jgi:hypothetical protein
VERVLINNSYINSLTQYISIAQTDNTTATSEYNATTNDKYLTKTAAVGGRRVIGHHWRIHCPVVSVFF